MLFVIRVRGRIRAAVCLGVSLASLVGCAGVLGIEDRTAEEGDAQVPHSDASLPDGAGTSGASGTTGATGASGGAAGAAGATGTSGASGAAGASGASGAAGASGATAGVAGDSGTSGAADASTDGTTDAHAGPDAGIVDAGPEPDVQVATCTSPCALKTGLNAAWAITSDANRVYWVEYGSGAGTSDGTVASCPLAGCDSAMITYTSSQVNPEGIAVDGQNVYWGSAGGIWTCPISGCTGSPTKVASADNPWGVAVDSMYVYWADNYDDNVSRAVKAPPDGGLSTATIISTGTNYITEPEQIALDSSFVYVTDYNGNVWRVPVGGGTPIGMGTGSLGNVDVGIAVDSTSLFYGEPSAIFAEPKTGTDGGTQIVSDQVYPTGLTVDSATGVLYWVNAGSFTAGVSDGVVGRVNSNGTGETPLATHLTAPFAITVRGAYVYWVSAGTPASNNVGVAANTGALYRMAK